MMTHETTMVAVMGMQPKSSKYMGAPLISTFIAISFPLHFIGALVGLVGAGDLQHQDGDARQQQRDQRRPSRPR